MHIHFHFQMLVEVAQFTSHERHKRQPQVHDQILHSTPTNVPRPTLIGTALTVQHASL